jgi:hypothetical protein
MPEFNFGFSEGKSESGSEFPINRMLIIQPCRNQKYATISLTSCMSVSELSTVYHTIATLSS